MPTINRNAISIGGRPPLFEWANPSSLPFSYLASQKTISTDDTLRLEDHFPLQEKVEDFAGKTRTFEEQAEG